MLSLIICEAFFNPFKIIKHKRVKSSQENTSIFNQNSEKKEILNTNFKSNFAPCFCYIAGHFFAQPIVSRSMVDQTHFIIELVAFFNQVVCHCEVRVLKRFELIISVDP